ncbi:MAG TPA: CHASE2 domain-containing protein [Candidatus Omnitrophota bacterium]|nr:CHASE2 domain-containing protein [Candidatus Omnitrophota bacterium]
MAAKRAFFRFYLFVACLSTLLVLLVSWTGVLNGMEQRFFDLSFRIRGPATVHSGIAIIDITDASLLKVGSLPWPRRDHADLLRILREYRPSAVFYDIIFSESSAPEDDAIFSEEIKQAGNVILPFYFAADKPSRFNDASAVLPIEPLKLHAVHLGYVNVIPDPDGHMRRAVVRISNYEHASLAMAQLYQRAHGLKALQFGPNESVLVNFPGPYSVFQSISFDRLVEHFEDPDVQSFLESIPGKVVLVGFTAAGVAMDLKPTAFSPQFPGLGLQASILHTLLTGNLIRPFPFVWHVALLFLFALVIVRLSLHANPMRGFFYVLALLVIVFELTQLAFQRLFLWIPFASFLLLGMTLYLGLILAEFIRVQIDREIFSRELTLAARIQKNFLPSNLPEISNLDLAALSLPARQVGGDFYDFVNIGNGKWGVCVGDVSGKGVPAALFMANAISEFRREADSNPPSEVLRRLNSKMSAEGPTGLFLTLLYLLIDSKNKKFAYSSAGHEPIFFYQKSRNSVQLLATNEGIPLGVDPAAHFDLKEQTAESGDLLFLQSDGVKEAMNPRLEIFGQERLKAVLLESADRNAKEIAQQVLEKINQFSKNTSQHDDLTMVCIKFR